MASSGEHHPAFEEYCECIFELREDNLEVIQARVAERLNVSRPSVSEMIHRMESEGLITSVGSQIRLTDRGEALASSVVRRHRLAERFLIDVLGLSWSRAHHEACKWEHVITSEVESAMNNLLGAPTTCPHGNPIPGSNYVAPTVKSLVAIEVGSEFIISRITEELEFVPGVLDFLEDAQIAPGHRGVVTNSHPDGSLTIRVDGNQIDIDAFAGSRIFVTI
ncbi:MAG: metal-dependent transcriptional regulator [Ilumatobacteraceae bacterium]